MDVFSTQIPNSELWKAPHFPKNKRKDGKGAVKDLGEQKGNILLKMPWEKRRRKNNKNLGDFLGGQKTWGTQ